MEVCRVVKTKDYTVMSNYHLRDRRLSAKEMGLLSFVLSLPDDWDFTVRGLTSLMRDGADSIYSAIKKLEEFGYVHRRQSRDAKGRLSRIEYSFYEKPQMEEQSQPEEPENAEIKPSSPYRENPDAVKIEAEKPPYRENPYTGNPYTENPAQRSTNLTNNLSNITNLSIQVSTATPPGKEVKDQDTTESKEELPGSYKAACRWVNNHSDEVERQHFEKGKKGDREFLAYRGAVEMLAGMLISKQPWDADGVPITAADIMQKVQEIYQAEETLYFMLRDTAERFAKAISENEIKRPQKYLRFCLWNNLQTWLLEYYAN